MKIYGAGQVIRTARLKAGVSLRELSNLLKVRSSGEISKYENNIVGLKFDTIDAIAEALKIPPEHLALECIKHHYPRLANPNTSIGKAFAKLHELTE